ncbi:UDP-N-acetylmuramoyl-L-alanine--D-glutamate ligase [Hydrogenophaga taeniospiralis]|uniref:UDP-N-acetylmuramoyl-L-alanine--D-glutamate ligase n=1 Tax=Hydrogenophaga taeniospiralis TaxID=65656 RepID=UPI001CF988C7|nr:UDP-N-acetylmuramoyl-L-alanine--D-glutamate ligase [Hydrogenophaga taeniospiralis]UCU95099.1 UDP-N-acetylmuramoyl-L-alanine--D-glutamate ligase [Hydrogenophaga taeniospiralis]
MNALKDQHVLILGLGISGLAMARWCVRHGAVVTVADTRENPPSLAALRAECPQAAFVAGPFDDSLLVRQPWNVIARSPGLPPEQLAPARTWAQQHGAAFVGELDLFAQALQDLSTRERLPYKPQVLAITGTNGKTTVTSLTGLLLQRCGLNVAVAGNIGPALLDVLGAALDAEAQAEAAERAEAEAAQQAEQDRLDAQPAAEPLALSPAGDVSEPAPVEEGTLPVLENQDELLPADAEEPLSVPGEDDDAPLMLVPPPIEPPAPPHLPVVWVLELSSFQLDGTAGGAWDNVPTAATVLNITEDHLDWHGSLAAYAQAKAAVYGAQALMLLNRDDAQVMAMKPGNVTVKVGGRNRQQPARPYATFGLESPTRPGDWGIESVNGMTWLVRALALDETRKRGRAADEEDEIYFQRLMPVDALRIRGRHNAANALAALALATSTGAPLGPMLHGLREYRGEPHRVEPVAIINGVEYFDDSKGTNVGATLAAINGLGADRRLVVILGGDGKGQDFSPLAAPLARHARAVLLIGRDAATLRGQVAQAVEEAGIPLLDASSLPGAVALAAQQALSGDAVLLSPACASLDMFKDYKHRAAVFVEAVAELAHEQGVELEGGL